MAKKPRELAEHPQQSPTTHEHDFGAPTDSVMNLGHRVPVDSLTQNPASHLPPYEGPNSEVAKSLNRDKNVKAQYGDIGKLDSGIASEQNLHKWGKFSQNNSYQRDPAYRSGRYPKNKDR